MSKWRNPRYRRWRWNKIKHGVQLLFSAKYRKEDREHREWLEQERIEWQRWNLWWIEQGATE